MLVVSSCWYILKCKFDIRTYEKWINNFLSNVNNFYLVIYTNKNSYKMLKKYESKPKIKIVIFELEEFYNYKYKNHWIKNHQNNHLLNKKIGWELNMLWSEKISFVKKTFNEKYFNGDWYAWCDIGYFRGGRDDISTELIKKWPNPLKIEKLDKTKIFYTQVNKKEIINNYAKNILNKNEKGLPKIPIDPKQISIAGGFFLIHNTKIDWWHKSFDDKLRLYFENERLVKDDQIIILDNILNNKPNFILIGEKNSFNNWFSFQRYLL